MRKDSIIYRAVQQAPEDELFDNQYLLGEVTQIFNQLQAVVNQCNHHDWALMVFLLERLADGLRQHLTETDQGVLEILGEMFGTVSYKRAVKAEEAHGQQKLTEEYYSDPEYFEVKMNERLRKMGFIVQEDGRVFGALDGDDNIVPVKQLLEQEERKNGV